MNNNSVKDNTARENISSDKAYICNNEKCMWVGNLDAINNAKCPECDKPLMLVTASINYCYLYYQVGNNLRIRCICPGLPRHDLHIEARDAVDLKDFIEKYIDK